MICYLSHVEFGPSRARDFELSDRWVRGSPGWWTAWKCVLSRWHHRLRPESGWIDWLSKPVSRLKAQGSLILEISYGNIARYLIHAQIQTHLDWVEPTILSAKLSELPRLDEHMSKDSKLPTKVISHWGSIFTVSFISDQFLLIQAATISE